VIRAQEFGFTGCRDRNHVAVNLGLRGILLIIAVILFVIAAISSGETAFDLICIGLACVAGALLAGELGGIGLRVGTSRRS
jgi:hypothetical protein